MANSKLLTNLSAPSTEPSTNQAVRPVRRGLAVRTELRAGAWDDIDDQISAFWNKLRSSVNVSSGANTPTSA